MVTKCLQHLQETFCVRYGAACLDYFLLRMGIAVEKVNAGEASKQKVLG